MRRVAPLLLALALFVSVAVLWIITDKRASDRVFDDYSSANTSDTGTSQALAYLARRGRALPLTRPLARQPLERDAVVFRLAEDRPVVFDPDDLDEKKVGPPRPKELPLLNDEEDAFVRRGGRMVLGAHSGLLPWSEPDSAHADRVFPMWPGADDLESRFASSGFTVLRPHMYAIFASGRHVIVARERIGEGDLFVVSWPDVFQNGSLKKADHLALLSALAGRRPVYFDEVIHGMASGDGALDLMKDWNLGPLLLMLLLVAALAFWRAGRRIGAPDDEVRETRSDAIDLVRSLAALYREVTKPSEALKLYHDSLTRTVAHTSGLRGDALHKRVSELTGGRHTMAAINEGFARLGGLRASRSPSLQVSKSQRRSVSETRRPGDSET